MRDLIVPEVEEPERFFPDPVLVKRPTIRVLDDGYGEFHHPDRDKWERIHPICIEIVEGLAKGLTFNELVKSLSPYPAQNINQRTGARLARKYCWKLHRLGYVDLALEEPPAVFADRYVRVKELGRGGLGIAHLCTDSANGDEPVVVKHGWGVKAPIRSGQKAMAHEIHLLQILDHPSIPRYYDHFESRGLLHLVREYFDGDKLSSAASPNRGDRSWRLDVTHQVATCLDLFHQAGFLFYDPSPDNFFLRPDGTVVVSDVGAARAFDGEPMRVRGPRGSPGYVAPEMRNNDDVRNRWASVQSDIYALGALYLFLTTGRRIGRTAGFKELVALLDDKKVGEADRAIIERLMADEPEGRPATMDEVRALLV